MKALPMISLRKIATLIVSAAALILSSCETTGDPTQGGLFGWSEGKAQGRLMQREAVLNDTRNATDSVERSNWKLEAQKAELRRQR